VPNMAGGGGSGFVISTGDIEATAPNAGAGSVEFTYSLDPVMTATPSSLKAGGTLHVTVSRLAPGEVFSLIVNRIGAVAHGTADAAGDPVTLSFKVPRNTKPGTYTIQLFTGEADAVTGPRFTVTSPGPTLALTNVTAPWWVAPGAGVLILGGILVMWLTRRRGAHR
jgi:hypothetical protein